LRSIRCIPRLGIRAALAICAALFAFAGTASAATTTLTFKEPEKCSTFAFVGNAPTSKKEHGFPTRVSAGDEVIFTNPLEAEGKVVGKIRVTCTATNNASSKHFAAAGFCTGIARIPGGTLVFAAELAEGNTEGAITGGSGKYAGVRGSFLSKEGKGASTVTMTLVE
jgi:ribosomal protein L2